MRHIARADRNPRLTCATYKGVGVFSLEISPPLPP